MSSEGVFLQGQCQYPSDRVTTTRPLARHTPRCRRSWGLPRGWLSGNQTRGNATTLVSPVFPCFHQWLEERTWGGVPCGEQAQSLPKIWNQMTATGALEEPGLPSGKPGCPARLETWQGCRIQQQRSSRLIPAPSAHAWGAPLYFSTPARPPPSRFTPPWLSGSVPWWADHVFSLPMAESLCVEGRGVGINSCTLGTRAVRQETSRVPRQARERERRAARRASPLYFTARFSGGFAISTICNRVKSRDFCDPRILRKFAATDFFPPFESLSL